MSGPRLASPRLVRSCLQVSCGWLGPRKAYSLHADVVQRAGARYGGRKDCVGVVGGAVLFRS